jgi:hypothetical protein
MFALHLMEPQAGRPVTGNEGLPEERIAGKERIRLPEFSALSVERLHTNGIFLVDNGVDMWLWVGRSADMNIMASLFGVHSLDDMDPTQVRSITRNTQRSRFLTFLCLFLFSLVGRQHKWRRLCRAIWGDCPSTT